MTHTPLVFPGKPFLCPSSHEQSFGLLNGVSPTTPLVKLLVMDCRGSEAGSTFGAPFTPSLLPLHSCLLCTKLEHDHSLLAMHLMHCCETWKCTYRIGWSHSSRSQCSVQRAQKGSQVCSFFSPEVEDPSQHQTAFQIAPPWMELYK